MAKKHCRKFQPAEYRAHERYRQTIRRTGDSIFIANLKNVSSRSLNTQESAKTKTKFDMTAKFGKMTQNKGHFAVQGHSRSPILVSIESSYKASYIKTIARQVMRIKS